jgi:hypothetical protein
VRALNNETLLKEIRDRFDDYLSEWKDIRDEANEDMRILADGPWTEKERRDREAADRPCISYDELGQYTSQTVGDMRQNKRAIKVTPRGNGATDQTAEKRAGMIRDIEYESHAQTAYQIAFDSMIKCSMGAWILGTQYCTEEGAEQELTVSPIANIDSLLLDPYAKKPDWSDMDDAYLLDSYSEKAFLKRWPDAEIRSFEGEMMELAPAWISAMRLQVAAYWKLDKVFRRRLWLGDPDNPTAVYKDELPKGYSLQDSAVVFKDDKGEKQSIAIVSQRKTEKSTVCQYITNGVEILETNPQKWKEIPIIPIFGPEEYVDDGAGRRKRLLSMVRKARGAFKSYCYVRTNEVEIIGLVPKVLYMGYEGQFNTKTEWDKVNKVAIPFGEVKAQTTATGQAILPLPERQLYDPPVQALEMAASSFRMAIQSAMGIGNGMVSGKGNQSLDAKSGKAIDAMDRQEAQGTYAYFSNFEKGLERTGRMLEDALDWCYDTPRDVGSRAPDDTYSSLKINQPVKDAQGNVSQFNTDDGDHGTTISVGPSEQSTRDAADDFVNTIMEMPNAPPKAIALGIRLKNLGPIGDELAKVFDPQDAGPDPQQQIGQLTQELQKAHAFGQAEFQKNQTKQPEIDAKIAIAKMQEETKRVLGLATINAQQAQKKLDAELGIVDTKVDQAHDIGMENLKHGNKKELAAGQQAHEQAAQASDQTADAASQDSAQDHATETQASDQEASADSQQSAQDASAEQAALKPAA